MTGKRFQYNVNKNCIECDGKFVAYLNSVDGWRIANKLTVLVEENEQLKEESEVCKQAYDEIKSDAINLKKENEELKSLIKALKKSNTDYIHQIKKAYEEDLSINELADNCGVDLE